MGSNKDDKVANTFSSENLNLQPAPKTNFIVGGGDTTPPSKFYPMNLPPITSTPEIRDYGLPMNLSRISERTEYNDWSKSELDKTVNTNNSYRPDVLSVGLSENVKSVESMKSSTVVSPKNEKEESVPKYRSVLYFLLGCLFPFCKVKI